MTSDRNDVLQPSSANGTVSGEALRSARTLARHGALAALSAALLSTTALPAMAEVIIDRGAIQALAAQRGYYGAPQLAAPTLSQPMMGTRVLPASYYQLAAMAPRQLEPAYMTPGLAPAGLVAPSAAGPRSYNATSSSAGYLYPTGFGRTTSQVAGPVIPSYLGPSIGTYGAAGYATAPVNFAQTTYVPSAAGYTGNPFIRPTSQISSGRLTPVQLAAYQPVSTVPVGYSGALLPPPPSKPRSRTAFGGALDNPISPAPVGILRPTSQPRFAPQGLSSSAGGYRTPGLSLGGPIIISSQTLGQPGAPIIQGRPVAGGQSIAPQALGAGGPLLISSANAGTVAPVATRPSAPKVASSEAQARPATPAQPTPSAAPTPAPAAARPAARSASPQVPTGTSETKTATQPSVLTQQPAPAPAPAPATPPAAAQAAPPAPQPSVAPPPQAATPQVPVQPPQAAAVSGLQPVTPPTQPAAAPEPPPTQQASLPPASDTHLGRIGFEGDTAELSDSAKNDLTGLASRLNADESVRIQLLAYASDSGDDASRARRLSLSRALAVRAYLIEQGVRSTRMDVRAFGSRDEVGGPADRVDIVTAQ